MSTVSGSVVDAVKSEFDFTVDKFPLSGPDGLKTPLYGLFRSDTMDYVGKPCSKHYVAHQSDDVLALVESAGEAFEGVGDVQCHFRDGHYVSIAPSKSERRAIYGTSDNIFPRFIVNAGYDGRAFSAIMGFYRDACSNLAMMRQVEGTSVSIRHGSGLREKMDDLIQTFSVLRESWATLGDVIAELQTREVRMAEFLDEVYGQPNEDSKRAITVHKNRTKSIWTRLNRERFMTQRPTMQDDRVSAWEAYNAVQGYVQHDATRKGSPSDFARIIQASNDSAVKKAESLALATLSV
ncbi:MAG: DUF932 domain-containing protein [Bacteroidetes bacterium]|nr:MAG: DUF932 domain-containing protein [Bacteroidota bacterium]